MSCKWIDKDGYVIIDFYLEGKHKHIREHRLVMEKYLKRVLDRKEHIHHLNGNKKDNRIENLELHSSNSAHLKKHHNKPWNKGKISKNKHICFFCKKEFVTIRQPKRIYCSQKCISASNLKIRRAKAILKKCKISNCLRHYCASGYCRFHYKKNYKKI